MAWSYIPLLLAVMFVLGIVIASWLWSREKKRGDEGVGPQADLPASNLPYRRAEGVLTPAEQSLLVMLKYVVGEDGHLLAKVRLGDLVAVSRNEQRREFYMNLARSKRVDFVLCHKKTTAPVLVFQVDDPSVRVSQDEQALTDKIITAAGLPMLRLSARETYGPNDLKRQMKEAMNQNGSSSEAEGG